MATPLPTKSENTARLLRILRGQGYMVNGRVGDSFLRHQYGITRREVCALIESQDGYCALCTWDLDKAKPGLESKPKWGVDHDPKRWEVRGVICFGCNTGLGKLGGRLASSEEAIENLKKAIAYLERFLLRRAK